MSIATLKKKTKKEIVPISGKGKDGFSFIGGFRNKGRVGKTYENQTTRTVFKGIDAVGYGGFQNEYVRYEIKPKINTNDSSKIKKPNLNTKGYILSRYENPTPVNNNTICNNGSCPPKWVKTFNSLNKTQGELIKKKRIISSSINSIKSKNTNSIKYEKMNCNNINNHLNNISISSKTFYNINGKRICIGNYYKDLRGAINSSEYLDILLNNNCLPTPPFKQSFPMVLNQPGGCLQYFYTPQEAINAGYLPKNWMNNSNTSSAFVKNPYC